MKRSLLALLAAVILSTGTASASDTGLIQGAEKVSCAIDYQAAVITSLTSRVPSLSYLDEIADRINSDKQKIQEIALSGNSDMFNQYLRNSLYPNMISANTAVRGIGLISLTENVRQQILSEFAAEKEAYNSCLSRSLAQVMTVSTTTQYSEPAKISAVSNYSEPAKKTVAAGVVMSDIEIDILKYTNAERTKNGLSELKLDDRLSQIARDHSSDMSYNNYFSHTNPAGEGPTQRAQRSGYDVHKDLGGGWSTHGIGENIAKMPTGRVTGIGYVAQDADSVAKATVGMWMRSEGHRANILNKNYDTIGLGVSYSSPYFFLTQNFK